MRTAGIICEYNPFHRGHLLQLRKTREMVGEDGAIVCLMSGYFVQRGEPALFSPRFCMGPIWCWSCPSPGR